MADQHFPLPNGTGTLVLRDVRELWHAPQGWQGEELGEVARQIGFDHNRALLNTCLVFWTDEGVFILGRLGGTWQGEALQRV